MSADPYRSPYAAEADPVRAAQARVLDEVAAGLSMLNKQLEDKKITPLDYRIAIMTLQELHDSVVSPRRR